MTSNVLFTGDARLITFSLTTSSGTASKWTFQGNAGDGFFTALNSAEWQTLQTSTAQGYYSVVTLPRWVRTLRTPSNSSTTLMVSQYIGA